MRGVRYLLLALLTVFMPSAADAESFFTQREALFGDWNGARSQMAEEGLEIELVYTGEIISIVSGGVRPTDGIYLDNTDLTLTLDTGKAGWWTNGTLFVYILSNRGEDPTDYVGDAQGSSNIEAANNTRLYEFWYEHSFAEDSVSLLFGLHDLNSEFLVTEYGGLFFNSSFGIQPDVSLNARPSIFPVAAPGVRIRWDVISKLTLMAAAYDGTPESEQENTNGFFVSVDGDKEGYMYIVEADYKVNPDGDESAFPPGTYKLGAWQNSGDFEELANNANTKSSSGFYLVADQMVYRVEGGQGLRVFLQYGIADKKVNKVDSYLGFGFNYVGLLPGRDSDTFGVAMAKAHFSEELAGIGGNEETVTEITYNMPLFPWLAIQPDMQIIENPGGDKTADTVTVHSVRIEVVF